MLACDFVVIDFETTGLSPVAGDRITEVAAVRILGGRITGRFESLANSGVRIPPFIEAYTGISQRMVDGAPPSEVVIRDLLAFIGTSPVVAHNASFDQRFLSSECTRARLASSHDDFICTMRLSRRVYPRMASYSLATIANQLKIVYRGAAHRAGADAEVTAELMIKLGSDLKARYSHLSIDALLLRRLMRMPAAKVSSMLTQQTAEVTASKW
ncbi:MAG TPA: 3'-5' exonuclease [Steroidobacteraceae bacterium]|nr:3'-5' exonuclease [Steroidobacteraceae bacterium]